MPWALAKDVPRSQNESFQEGYQINIVKWENCGKLPLCRHILSGLLESHASFIHGLTFSGYVSKSLQQRLQ